MDSAECSEPVAAEPAPFKNKFPPELLDRIIDHLAGQNDRKSLGTCSLVCRQWLPASRLHIFGVISVHPWNIRSLADILSSSTNPSFIPTAIRNIKISADLDENNRDVLSYVEYSECLLIVLRYFTNFCTLDITEVDFTELDPACVTELLREDEAGLTFDAMILKLVTVNSSVELARLIAKSKSLKFLGLGPVSGTTEFTEENLASLPTSIRSLKHLVLWGKTAFSIAPFLLRQPCAEMIVLFVSVCHSREDLGHIQNLVTKSVSTLQHLAFQYGSVELDTPLDLSASTNIVNLSFDICLCEKLSSHVTHLTSSILSLSPNPALKEVIFYCEPAEVNLAMIDEYLTSEGTFPNLKRVTFLMITYEDEPWVTLSVMLGKLTSSVKGGLMDLEMWAKERLPLCAERGLVKGTHHWGEWTGQPFGNMDLA